ncbi:LacI family DNA-binding transcriptional regulator [Luethyella okanaganae]|uniref:LacI family DNA-binding transcriptional regulator n=1 Tax=Luethyella okanaganae TaxID=69372 RepID=A0ABW1VF35_9MICO
MSKVTIKTVAEHAGVSTATVSRALSGTGLVSPELRLAVTKAAEKLGYSGNTVARALRSSRTNAVGMVVPEIANPFMTDLVQEVEQSLHLHGIQLLLCNSRQDPSRERAALTSLIGRRVDGLIICPVDATSSFAGVEAAVQSLPVVQVDQRIEGLNADWVGVDDETAMRLIVEHLSSQGVTSAAFAGSKENDSSSKARLDAFLRHAGALGISVAKDNIFLDRYSVDCGRESMERLIRSGSLPNALVCAADIIAIGALQTCHAQKITVPDDLLITGFDDIEFANLCTPRLTTVRQPLKAIANHAVDILRSVHAEDDHAAVRLALAPTLVIRESSSARTHESAS